MNNSLNLSLEQLGFSAEESSIYLNCLEYGSLPVSVISRNTKIGRINCYHYIEKLCEKGLLLEDKKRGVKCFSAENPKLIIKKQQEKIAIAQNILPEMIALSAINPQKPKIRFFEGIDGVQKMFDIMVETPNIEMLSFSNVERLNYLPENYLKKHFLLREEKNIKTRFITPNSENAINFHKQFLQMKNENLIEIFFINPDESHFFSEITIFSGQVAIFSLSEKNSQGVLIENSEIFQTQKSMFDLAWLGATSFVT